MTNVKILKSHTLPIVLFTDASLTLIKKVLWLIFCFFLKFNNKPIFDYQNVHLLYGPIWKNLNLKGKNAGNTVKCQANFLAYLLWSSIDKFTYYNLKRLIPSLCPLSSGGQRTDCCLGLQISKGGKKCHKWWLWQMNI